MLKSFTFTLINGLVLSTISTNTSQAFDQITADKPIHPTFIQSIIEKPLNYRKDIKWML